MATLSPKGQKTAFVTGASSGIGKAAALALSGAGYRVIGTSRKAASGEIRDGIRMIACDVTSDTSVSAAVALAHSELGRIDLLVNNAGYAVSGAAEESSTEQVRALFDTNFLGVVRVMNAVLPIMRHQGGGRILNIGSVVGLIPGPFGAYYTASKHAIEGYSESLDHEVRVVRHPGRRHRAMGDEDVHRSQLTARRSSCCGLSRDIRPVPGSLQCSDGRRRHRR